MPTPSSIGQRFTQLIQHLGLSKNAFAQSLDKTATVIQHLVDERNKPGYDLLCKVFEVYPNVSKDWLLLGQGPMMADEAPPLAASAPTSGPVAPLPAPAAPEPLVAAPVAAPTPPAPAAATAPAPPAQVEAAPALPPLPDASYLATILNTQHLQHQLALAEQRNQHLLEQQQLMQQMVAMLQSRPA
ncbi:hypothetical protein GO988_15340 [Hymenobacter sp. HMF4947]|uniref:XRE family transcriptional regulator n=1 Tax=Hymenobacter ginkgonis TaxID=2682976 RepID=A0A7K1TH08_9BACT|nr:helix-turn-helix transcriptional regulator [Hymenobacter ginkgonis]MVN77706.1 hypothetical protein [Hymenobacter ginkgonis]